MSIQNIILKKKIAGVLTTVYPETVANQVYFTKENGDVVSMSVALADILSAIAGLSTSDEVTAAIDARFNQLVDGAPEALDTLKEVADALAKNDDVVEALNTAIGNKVTAEDGKGLVEDVLVEALKELDTAALKVITTEKTAKWDLGEANVIEGVTLNGVDTPLVNKKAVLTTARVLVSTEVPADMTDEDILFQIVE